MNGHKNYLVICMKCGDHFRTQNTEFGPHICNNILNPVNIKMCISILIDCFTGGTNTSKPSKMPPPMPPPMPTSMLPPMLPVISSPKLDPTKENAKLPCFLDELNSVLLYVWCLKKTITSLPDNTSDSKESKMGSVDLLRYVNLMWRFFRFWNTFQLNSIQIHSSVRTMKMIKPSALDDMENKLKYLHIFLLHFYQLIINFNHYIFVL